MGACNDAERTHDYAYAVPVIKVRFEEDNDHEVIQVEADPVFNTGKMLKAKIAKEYGLDASYMTLYFQSQ